MNSIPIETEEERGAGSSYPHPEESIPVHWQEQMVTANGIQQHVYRTGGSTPLLLIHGFMVDSTGWVRTAGALASDYDVIMPDARAHGKSARAGGDFSLETLGADAIALIEALDVGKVALLGHSMGAGTAAYVAATRPELVSKLILEEPALRAAPDMRQLNLDWYNSWLATMQALRTQSHQERMSTALERMMPHAGGWNAADLVPWVYGMAAFDLSVLGLGAALYKLPPWNELVPQIECPLLLLTGDPARGSTSTPEAVQAWAAVWQNGQHHPLDGGHVLHAEAFHAFVAAVQDFLED